MQREVRRGLQSDVVGAGADFLREPGLVGALLDLEDVGEDRMGGEGARSAGHDVAHPEVDEPPPQVVAVDPGGGLGVALRRHEDGQREPSQHPFGGAAPARLLVPHLDQLADERQVRAGHAQGLRESIP